MIDACLSGLEASYRAQVDESGVVDFDRIQPGDVNQELTVGMMNLDWSSVIFIKNFKPIHQQGKTIIWSTTAGFCLTKTAPGVLLRQLAATKVVGWFDMKVMVKFLEVSRPAPFVLGPMMLISTERSARAGHTSWIGGRFIHHIVAAQKEHVRIMLNNGLSLVIKDTVSRLSKKITEANQIFDLEQRIQRLVAQQNGPDSPTVGVSPHADAYVLRYFDFHDLYFTELVQLKSGFQTSDRDRQVFLQEMLGGDRRSWHFDDERGESPI